MQKNLREKNLALLPDLSHEPRPGDARGDVAAHPRPCLHDLGTQARVRDRLSFVPAISNHRSRGRVGLDVDGHDDAATGGRFATVQADLLRSRRWLESGGGKPD